MNFQQTVETHFPGTLSETEFIVNSQAALTEWGFNAENSIACVGACRDEITRTLIDKVQDAWGEAFNFSSLGGMMFAGKTGFSAAHHHAPIENGREHYVYFAMAHIAIDQNGDIGVCYRPGRSEPSGACGALIAFRQEMLSGDVALTLDWDDVEQSLMKQRLLKKMKYGEIPDLLALTKTAYEVILSDLKHLIAETVDVAVSDYAVLCGIQIHGANKEQFVWPGEMYVVKNGQRSAITISFK